MKNVIINIVIIFLISGLGLDAQQSDVRTITITGEGEATIKPDKLIIMIPLMNLSEKLEDAKADNDSRLEAIKDILELFSIAEENLEIRSFEVRSSDRQSSKTDEDKTYRVAREVVIAVDEDEIREELIDALINAGLDNFSASGYIYPGKQAYRREAKLKAVENAGQNAKAIAEVLGLKTGKVLSIKESSPDQWDDIEDSVRDEAGIYKRHKKTETADLNGLIRLTASVTVVMELTD